MTDRASAGRTARLILRYWRDPSRYGSEARRPDAPPLDFDVVLRLAQGREVAFGSTSIEGASREALTHAAGGYLRNVCFRADATPYQTFGLAPDASPEAIKERFRQVMLLVHPDRHGAEASWPPEFAAHANRAYALLRDPRSREKYDRDERERAEQALASQRAAVAAAAATSRRELPGAVRRARRPPPEPVLPEWLSAGVGGYVRAHPAGVAVGTLAGVSVLVAGFALWEGDAASLTRGGRAADAAELAQGRPAAEPMPSYVASALSAPRGKEVRPASEASAPAAAESASAHVRPRIDSEAGAASPRAAAVEVSPAASRKAGAAPPGDPPAIIRTAPATARAPATAALPAAASGTRATGAMAAPAASEFPPSMAAAPATRGTSPPAVAEVAPQRAAVVAQAGSVDATVSAAVAAPPPGPAALPAPVATASPSPVATASHAPAATALPAPAATVSPAPIAIAPPAPVATASPAPAVMPHAAVARAESPATGASPRAPSTAEIESLFVAFVEAYDRGRADVFASLFDADARANQHQGRAAIRGEYDDYFRRTEWRQMRLMRMNWQRVGEVARANGEIAIRAGLRDGREESRRVAVDMELALRDGRLVITRLDQRPGSP